MKKLAITIILVFQFVITTKAQCVVRSLRFDTIGWTVNVPLEFEIMEIADEKELLSKGKKMIEETSEVVADMSKVINLFSSKNASMNYFAATIEPFGTDYTEWLENNAFVKGLLMKSFQEKMPNASFDTLSSKATIDGIDFIKFSLIIKVKENFMMNWTSYWHLYKGFDFSINYVCTSDRWVKELDKCIIESKFKR